MRQFVLLHLIKLINILKDIIEEQLYHKLDKFKFVNNNDKSLKNLTHDLAEKETELLKINPDKMSENTDVELLTNDVIAQSREEILADLKKQNPELETDNWI